ncbi:hypothetical protein Q73A0000_01360 [Kaistella flava (ex Peng et al. 2021)]|uniref:Uncharacterized protein n=1 Tax=Kaistella flava (ex Peng et al. 2021) TaxID=2038776 RepID=A0A7M2Y4P7_9FLAO|nr:hypothetical protein [Kaistella flava (ex Peng et al. 2021)]QOW09090.1 hypothetical protein Q73A0000_01360 [Kaistella flava (ex Peng et al. 2021)]
MAPEQIKKISFQRPVAVVTKYKGCEVFTEYFLYGRRVQLHEFKKRCKSMQPIEVVVLESYKKQ